MLLTMILLFGLAFAINLLFTRFGRRLATRIGLLDLPDGQRKLHAHPVPLIGGVAFLFAVPLTLILACYLSEDIASAFRSQSRKIAALMCGACLIAAVGLVDDIYKLRARYKLLGQTFAACVFMLVGDFLIRHVNLFGAVIHLGSYAVPCTLIWLLFFINAANLLDGMDGMLGTVAVIAFVGLISIADINGASMTKWICVAAAGGLIGFLRFNWKPASVYLGDCGSLLIGFILATLSIDATTKGSSIGILAPACLLIVPFLDTVAAVIRRMLTRCGLAIPDRGHIHHVLLRQGYSAKQILILIGGFGLFATSAAIVSIYWQNDWVPVCATFSLGSALLLFRLFGWTEVALIWTCIKTLLRIPRRNKAIDADA